MRLPSGDQTGLQSSWGSKVSLRRVPLATSRIQMSRFDADSTRHTATLFSSGDSAWREVARPVHPASRASAPSGRTTSAVAAPSWARDARPARRWWRRRRCARPASTVPGNRATSSSRIGNGVSREREARRVERLGDQGTVLDVEQVAGRGIGRAVLGGHDALAQVRAERSDVDRLVFRVERRGTGRGSAGRPAGTGARTAPSPLGRAQPAARARLPRPARERASRGPR